MSHTTDESDNGRLSRNQSGLSLTDDENTGEIMGWGAVLKKGPWTTAEDALLVDYVKNYGEGNWNAVQKHSGLSRCGKSCRLRWANHLRPNLKKGSFTADEERLIVELHAKMGNKWARMAAHLPGRTDNEIKNYWNTRIKRRQRSGAPLYPPEVFLQAYPEYQNQITDRLSSGNKRHHDILQSNSYELPRDFSTNSYYNFTPPTINGHKRMCDSTHLYSSQDGKVRSGLHQFNHFQYDPSNENKSSCGLSFPYDPDDPSTKYHSPFEEIQGIHFLNNGKFSPSKPTSEAVKSELPSLQYSETDLSSWGTFPLLESVDTDSSLQSPLMGTLKSEISTPRNSGLLEALLDEAKTLGSATKPSSNKSSGSSAVTPCDIADTSKLNLSEVEWEEYAESFSTFDHSANRPSIVNDCTPITGGGSSSEEHSPANNPGKVIKSEPVDQAWTFDRQEEVLYCCSRPDVLLGSGWLEQCTINKGKNVISDPISRLLGSDCGTDYKYIVSGILSPCQDHELPLSSCTWDNMSTACQMYDFESEKFLGS